MEPWSDIKKHVVMLAINILLILVAISLTLHPDKACAFDNKEYRPDYTWAEDLGRNLLTESHDYWKAAGHSTQGTYAELPDLSNIEYHDLTRGPYLEHPNWRLEHDEIIALEHEWHEAGARFVENIGTSALQNLAAEIYALDALTEPSPGSLRLRVEKDTLSGNMRYTLDELQMQYDHISKAPPPGTSKLFSEYKEYFHPQWVPLSAESAVSALIEHGYSPPSSLLQAPENWTSSTSELGLLTNGSLDFENRTEQIRLQKYEPAGLLQSYMDSQHFLETEFMMKEVGSEAIQPTSFDDYRDIIRNMELEHLNYIHSLSSDHTTLDYIHPTQPILDTFQPSSFYDYTQLGIDIHDNIYQLELPQAPDWSELQNMSTMDTQQFNDYLDTIHQMESQHLIDLTNLRNIEIPTGINHLESFQVEPIFIEPIRIIDY